MKDTALGTEKFSLKRLAPLLQEFIIHLQSDRCVNPQHVVRAFFALHFAKTERIIPMIGSGAWACVGLTQRSEIGRQG